MEKTKLRQEMIKRRDQIPENLQAEKTRRIQEVIECLPEFLGSRRILLYYSVGSEVGTRMLIEKWKEKKEFYLPVIENGGKLSPVCFKAPFKLKKNREGVWEPEIKEKADQPMDLILVPGVAFDKKGGRLGRGKGYYDRLLSNEKSAFKVGLAFEEQMLDQIPKDPYDVDVDMIVTDQSFYPSKEAL